MTSLDIQLVLWSDADFSVYFHNISFYLFFSKFDFDRRCIQHICTNDSDWDNYLEPINKFLGFLVLNAFNRRNENWHDFVADPENAFRMALNGWIFCHQYFFFHHH